MAWDFPWYGLIKKGFWMTNFFFYFKIIWAGSNHRNYVSNQMVSGLSPIVVKDTVLCVVSVDNTINLRGARRFSHVHPGVMGTGLCSKLHIGLTWWTGGSESRWLSSVGTTKTGNICNGLKRLRAQRRIR